MSEVWIVQSGEDGEVVLAAESLSAAVGELQRRHMPLYIVVWDEPIQRGDDYWSIVGHFEWVPNLSTKHESYFDITRLAVVNR